MKRNNISNGVNKADFNLNWPILGNGHIVEFLAKSIAADKVAGSYVFTGPDNLGKTTTANYFAYSLLCQNREKGAGKLPCGECPACRQHQFSRGGKIEDGEETSIHGDLHIIRRDKDKKNISIEQVRDFIRTLGLSSFLNSYKIGIIKHAESLSLEAANALLKTLEEPKAKVVIILVTADPEALPQTIISRSQVLRFYPVNVNTIYDYLVKERGGSRSAAKNFSRLSLGRPALAVKFLEDKDFYESYLKRVRAFLAFSREDFNGRFALIEELLSAKSGGQETARLAKRIIEIWQGLTRDLILLNYGEGDLVQHEVVIEELNGERAKYSLPALLNLVSSLRQAEEYLKANVNPKLVLENVAMSI